MNKLIIPAVIAVLAGVGGGSGAAYVSAKKAAVTVAAHLADSVKSHVKDSTEKAEKAEIIAKAAADSAHQAASEILTPADSIRAAKNMPTTLGEATHGLPNAIDPKHTGVVAKVDPKAAVDASHKGPVSVAPTKAPEAMHAAAGSAESVLPEERLIKIFSAMQAKDAARVFEQMSDSDVRIILSKMPDKQAAAILATLSSQRAAVITRGEKKADVKTDSKVETKSEPKTEPKAEAKGDKKAHGENS